MTLLRLSHTPQCSPGPHWTRLLLLVACLCVAEGCATFKGWTEDPWREEWATVAYYAYMSEQADLGQRVLSEEIRKRGVAAERAIMEQHLGNMRRGYKKSVRNVPSFEDLIMAIDAPLFVQATAVHLASKIVTLVEDPADRQGVMDWLDRKGEVRIAQWSTFGAARDLRDRVDAELMDMKAALSAASETALRKGQSGANAEAIRELAKVRHFNPEGRALEDGFLLALQRFSDQAAELADRRSFWKLQRLTITMVDCAESLNADEVTASWGEALGAVIDKAFGQRLLDSVEFLLHQADKQSALHARPGLALVLIDMLDTTLDFAAARKLDAKGHPLDAYRARSAGAREYYCRALDASLARSVVVEPLVSTPTEGSEAAASLPLMIEERVRDALRDSPCWGVTVGAARGDIAEQSTKAVDDCVLSDGRVDELVVTNPRVAKEQTKSYESVGEEEIVEGVKQQLVVSHSVKRMTMRQDALMRCSFVIREGATTRPLKLTFEEAHQFIDEREDFAQRKTAYKRYRFRKSPRNYEPTVEAPIEGGVLCDRLLSAAAARIAEELIGVIGRLGGRLHDEAKAGARGGTPEEVADRWALLWRYSVLQPSGVPAEEARVAARKAAESWLEAR